MFKFKPVLLILFLASIISACKKPSQALPGKQHINATVHYSGPVAADGCGWLIKMDSDSIEYSPVNLAASFQKDNLKVNVTYTLLTTRFHCGMLADAPGIPEIRIENIK